MKWPTHSDYQDAIQNPAICFQEPDLKLGTITCDMLGLPRVMSGNFASVYELRTPKGRWAIRCFVRQVAGQQGRYVRLSQYLANVNLDCLVKFEYFLKGILVHGDWYAIVQMEWVQGLQLNSYVEEHLQEPEVLLQLATKWRTMVNQLRAHSLAHGDLQHGNVMVTSEGELRLVDYDGMYCPAFGRGRSPELGHTNFQHPCRTPDYYEEGLDNFAALVIYVSLLALAREPELWSKFNGGDNLIFAASDYRNTQNSEAFQRLKASPDKQVQELTHLLQQCCIAPVALTPWFEDVVVALEQGKLPELTASLAAQSAAPAASTAAGKEWLETKPGAPATAEASAEAEAALVEPAFVSAPPQKTSAGPSKALLAAAAIVVVLLAGSAGWFFGSGRKAAGPPAKPATAPAAATPSKPSPGGPPEPAPGVAQPARAASPAPALTTIAPVMKSTEVRSLAGHGCQVTWVGFVGDGRMLATGGEDGTIKFWDAATGQPGPSLAGQGDGVTTGVLAADGKSLLAVSADNSLRFWDMASAQVVKTVSDHTRNLWGISVSPDGQTLATGASDRKIVRLLDPRTGALKKMLSQHASWVRAVDFSPDSKLAAVSCWDDSVKVWTIASGEGRKPFTVLSNTVDSVRFSPDGALLASAGQGRTVKLWDTQTGALRQTFIGHNGDIKCYAFSPGGALVASGSADKTVRVWRVADGLLRETFVGHGEDVLAVAFAPSGKVLASASADQTVKLWDVSKLSQ